MNKKEIELQCDIAWAEKYGQEINIVKGYIGEYCGYYKMFKTHCFVDCNNNFTIAGFMGSK